MDSLKGLSWSRATAFRHRQAAELKSAQESSPKRERLLTLGGSFGEAFTVPLTSLSPSSDLPQTLAQMSAQTPKAAAIRFADEETSPEASKRATIKFTDEEVEAIMASYLGLPPPPVALVNDFSLRNFDRRDLTSQIPSLVPPSELWSGQSVKASTSTFTQEKSHGTIGGDGPAGSEHDCLDAPPTDTLLRTPSMQRGNGRTLSLTARSKRSDKSVHFIDKFDEDSKNIHNHSHTCPTAQSTLEGKDASHMSYDGSGYEGPLATNNGNAKSIPKRLQIHVPVGVPDCPDCQELYVAIDDAPVLKATSSKKRKDARSEPCNVHNSDTIAPHSGNGATICNLENSALNKLPSNPAHRSSDSSDAYIPNVPGHGKGHSEHTEASGLAKDHSKSPKQLNPSGHVKCHSEPGESSKAQLSKAANHSKPSSHAKDLTETMEACEDPDHFAAQGHKNEKVTGLKGISHHGLTLPHKPSPTTIHLPVPGIPSLSIPTITLPMPDIPAGPPKPKKRDIVKHAGQKAIRKGRTMVLKKPVLCVVVGRQLAGPTSQYLELIANGGQIAMGAATKATSAAPL